METAQASNSRGWKEMEVPHKYLNEIYKRRLNECYFATKEFIIKAEEGKQRVTDLYKYLSLEQHLVDATRGQAMEERYFKIFEHVTDGSRREIDVFRNAIKQWRHQNFKQELFYFQHSLDTVVAKLKRSVVQQEGWKTMSPKGVCETDLTRSIWSIRDSERAMTEQGDRMEKVIEEMQRRVE